MFSIPLFSLFVCVSAAVDSSFLAFAAVKAELEYFNCERLRSLWDVLISLYMQQKVLHIFRIEIAFVEILLASGSLAVVSIFICALYRCSQRKAHFGGP